MNQTNMIAVKFSEYEKHGCVNCGCDYNSVDACRTGSTIPVICNECDTHFVILSDDLTHSAISFGEERFTPQLQTHPRLGIPKHEYVRPDIRPETEGDFWAPRGIGYDLSGFVKSKEAGARIIDMVRTIIGKDPKSWLDYRPSEPKWIQVKIQASDDFDLETLRDLCKDDGIITEAKLKQALVAQNN